MKDEDRLFIAICVGVFTIIFFILCTQIVEELALLREAITP